VRVPPRGRAAEPSVALQCRSKASRGRFRRGERRRRTSTRVAGEPSSGPATPRTQVGGGGRRCRRRPAREATKPSCAADGQGQGRSGDSGRFAALRLRPDENQRSVWLVVAWDWDTWVSKKVSFFVVVVVVDSCCGESEVQGQASSDLFLKVRDSCAEPVQLDAEQACRYYKFSCVQLRFGCRLGTC